MTIQVQAEDELRSEGTGGIQTPVSSGQAVAVEDIGEGIIRITLRAGGRITADDGILVRDSYGALTGGAGAAILLQITGVESVSRDAVRFFSEAVTVRAYAVLGTTPVDRIIAHGRRGLPAPQCPTRYFTEEHEALDWLRTLTATSARAIEPGY